MAAAAVAPVSVGGFDRRTATLLSASAGLHLFVFVLLPLSAHLFWRPRVFRSPPTFELVRMSLPKPAAPAAKPAAARKVPDSKAALKPAERKAPASPENKPPQEDTDELDDLLDRLPAPAVSVSLGSADFKYQWYINVLLEKVQRGWVPPYERTDVAALVSFTILRDGSISEVKLARSSGDATLDNLGLRAVKLAAPFPPLPVGFSESTLELTLNLVPKRQ